MANDSRLGSYVNAAAALGAGWLEAEAADHAGYVFEAPGVSWMQHYRSEHLDWANPGYRARPVRWDTGDRPPSTPDLCRFDRTSSARLRLPGT